MRTAFLSENLQGRNYMNDFGADGSIVKTGPENAVFIRCLRTGISDGIL
jgi:hypothetical protein